MPIQSLLLVLLEQNPDPYLEIVSVEGMLEACHAVELHR